MADIIPREEIPTMGRESDNRDNSELRLPRLLALGLGGGGSNAVERMAREGLVGVELAAVNTDIQALGRSKVPVRLPIGYELTRGLGAGGDPEVGRKAALESSQVLRELISDFDMVFLAAGLGGGTGTGAAPVVAAIAADLGVLSVAVVTLPFDFEGRRRRRQAEEGLAELARGVDTYLAIENQRLLETAGADWPIDRAFALSDQILHQSVEGLSDLLFTPGEVNVDFADVRAIMRRGGRAVLGIGQAEGEDRARRAAQAAVGSSLVADTSLAGAGAVLINISGGHDLTLHEVGEAAAVIQDAVEDDAEVITGMVLDERFAGRVQVTAVVTGFGERRGGDSTWLEATLGVGEALSPEEEETGDTKGDLFRSLPETDEEGQPKTGRGPGGGGRRRGFGLAPPREQQPEVAVDKVHFTVTAPRSLEAGSLFILDVWAHTREQREEVLERARDEQGTEIRHKSKGPVTLARGSELMIRVSIPKLEVEDPQGLIEWQGEIGNATFPVAVPEGLGPGSVRGEAAIHAGGFEVAKVHFILQVGRRPADVAKVPSWENRHRRAFCSYSSRDRDDVLGRIQGMQKIAPGLDPFLDVLKLRSGQYWEQELWREIPRSDVFYLFWSSNALASEWVEKEWRCALKSKGIEFIDPVPLEPPDLAPPPRELGAKHFNDWILAFQRHPAPS